MYMYAVCVFRGGPHTGVHVHVFSYMHVHAHATLTRTVAVPVINLVMQFAMLVFCVSILIDMIKEYWLQVNLHVHVISFFFNRIWLLVEGGICT